MSNIYDKAQKKQIDELVNPLIEIISQLEKSENNEEVISLVRERIDLIKKELNKNKESSKGELWDFGIEKTQDLLTEDDVLELKPLTADYYDLYIKTRYAYLKYKYNPLYRKLRINEITSDEVFFAAAIRKKDNAYIGYVGIKDTTEELWEIAVELLPEYCNNGYGYKTLRLFLKKIAEITENSKMQFRALVEVENIASQKLMRKLGGKLTGIYNYVFHNKDKAKEFEEEHLNEITDHMTELAKELNVEPRKLLSHVLDYRIFAENL